jgi:hypothetical protein
MFYSLKNLSDSVTVALEKPWEWQPGSTVPYPTNADGKNDFIHWGHDFQTDHAFIAAFEGMSDGVRVTKDNPVFQMHAIIADYDGRAPKDMADYVKQSMPTGYHPQYLVHTATGNSRLVWLFEKPITIANEDLLKKFLAQINKELKLVKWAPGFDVDAYRDPKRYYEIGKSWEPLYPDKRIASSLLEAWLLKSSDGLRFNKDQTLRYKIPMEDLSAEMHRKYPGRWHGDLFVGARGIRFWDPSADNDSAAVIFEEGVYCFTGNRPFVTWESIFGKAFVDKYEADYVAGATEDSAYDGRNYWIMGGGVWTQWSKEDFTQELRVRGYDGTKPRDKTCSEIDTIENTIKKTRRVTNALPFLYYPPGIITWKGEKFMNTSRVKVMAPAAPFHTDPVTSITDIAKVCPFLHDFFLSMFSENQDPNDPQLIALLSWIKYFYQTSYEGRPGPGQAVVLAGNAGKGKTFFSRALLGGLMGGESDASSHLVDGAQWTEDLAKNPIMRIDDAVATSDFRGLNKFTQRLKRYVANSSINCNAKYKSTGEVPWFGRPIITCNLDPESLRIMPGMDQSTRDKVMLFKTVPVKVKFKSWEEMDRILKVELPKFARFLLEWPMPEDRVAPEARFGIKAYHDRSLFEEAVYQSADGVTTEALIGFLSDYFQQYPDKECWEGPGILLHSNMSDKYNSNLMNSIKPRQLTTCLGNLAKSGYDLKRYRSSAGSRCWRINKSMLEQQKESAAEEISYE